MDKVKFNKKLFLFCENFDYKFSKTYAEIIYKGFFDNGLNAEDFEKAFQRMMYKPKGYGRPSLGDWIDESGKRDWINQLNNYKALKNDVKDSYLMFIKENEPKLYKMITNNKILRLENKNED